MEDAKISTKIEFHGVTRVSIDAGIGSVTSGIIVTTREQAREQHHRAAESGDVQKIAP